MAETAEKILVTKTFLPPIEEYGTLLENIWDSGWVTNNGRYVKELEKTLEDFLGVDNLVFVSNGTIAIQIAIKALELSGEIITTPFSYVATTSSIVWENCIPVFADIDEKTFCINALSIETLITENTSAILATNVFGNICDFEIIEKNSQKV